MKIRSICSQPQVAYPFLARGLIQIPPAWEGVGWLACLFMQKSTGTGIAQTTLLAKSDFCTCKQHGQFWWSAGWRRQKVRFSVRLCRPTCKVWRSLRDRRRICWQNGESRRGSQEFWNVHLVDYERRVQKEVSHHHVTTCPLVVCRLTVQRHLKIGWEVKLFRKDRVRNCY